MLTFQNFVHFSATNILGLSSARSDPGLRQPENMSLPYDHRDIFGSQQFFEETIQSRPDSIRPPEPSKSPSLPAKSIMATVLAIGVGVAAAAFLVSSIWRLSRSAVLANKAA